MRRRLLTSLVLAVLLALPQAGWAQEPAEPMEEGSADEPVDAFTLLTTWVGTVAEAFGVDLDAATPEVTTAPDDVDPEELETARAAFSELLDAALQGLAVEFMVAEATADAATLTDDAEVEASAEEGTEVASDEVEDGSAHGEIVRTVAHCAPRGFTAKGWLDGVRNHGQFVSTAARGGTVELSVPVVVEGEDGPELSGESEQVSIALDTVEGAQELCAAIAAIEDAKALAAALEDAGEDTDDPQQVGTSDDAEDEAKGKGKGKGKGKAKADAQARKADRAARKAEKQQRKADRGGDERGQGDETEDTEG